MDGEQDEPRVRAGAVKSLEADGLRRPSPSNSHDCSEISSRSARRRVSSRWGRREPVARDESSASAGRHGPRVDAKASPQRRGPPQSPRLSQPFRPEKREHGIVCLALHARREETEIPDVVPVAVGHVVGERGQELSRRAGDLDGAFRARVLRHKSDFLTGDRPEPVLRDGRPAGVPARIAEELLLASEPLDVDVDRVFPRVPVRQWVLSLPPRLRYRLAWDHALCRAVVGRTMRAILASSAGERSPDGEETAHVWSGV